MPAHLPDQPDLSHLCCDCVLSFGDMAFSLVDKCGQCGSGKSSSFEYCCPRCARENNTCAMCGKRIRRPIPRNFRLIQGGRSKDPR